MIAYSKNVIIFAASIKKSNELFLKHNIDFIVILKKRRCIMLFMKHVKYFFVALNGIANKYNDYLSYITDGYVSSLGDVRYRTVSDGKREIREDIKRLSADFKKSTDAAKSEFCHG